MKIGMIGIISGLLSTINAFGQMAGPDKQAAFITELSRWVSEALSVSDPEKARYVMRRTGCSIVVKKAANEKVEFLPIADQIKKCASEIANFDCRATRSLVKDNKVVENKYYDYCKSKQ